MSLRYLVRSKRSGDDHSNWHVIEEANIDEYMDETGECVLERFPLEEPFLSLEEMAALNAVFDLDDVGGQFFIQTALEKILDHVAKSQ